MEELEIFSVDRRDWEIIIRDDEDLSPDLDILPAPGRQ